MHKKGADELARARGGPLGVRRLKAIVVGVTDLNRARQEWRKLIDTPGQEQGDVFHFGAGPSIQLVSALSPGMRESCFRWILWSEPRRFSPNDRCWRLRLEVRSPLRRRRSADLT